MYHTYSSKILIVLLCCFLLSSLGLFAGGQEESAMSDDQIALSVWYHAYGEEGTKEATEHYAEMYEESHPGVDVQVNWMVGDWRQKLYAALASKSSDPDVYEESAPTATMIQAGQAADLTDLFSAEAKKDFFPAAMDVNMYNGKIYGARMFIDATGFYYSKNAFSSAGVDVPESLSDLIAAAKKLDSPDRRGAYIGNGLGVGTFGYMIVWASGIEGLISEDGTKIMLDDPRVVAALENYRKLAKSNALLLGYPVSEWQPDALVNEECAIQWGGMWFFPQMRDEMGDGFGVFPMPKSIPSGTVAASSGGFSSIVNGFSDQLDAAKEYVKWMWIDKTGQDIQVDFATAYGFHMPAKKSVANIATKITDDARSAYMAEYTSEYGVYKSGNGYGNSNVWDSVMHTAFTDMLSAVVNTDEPIAPLVKKAAAACQARLDEIQ